MFTVSAVMEDLSMFTVSAVLRSVNGNVHSECCAQIW